MRHYRLPHAFSIQSGPLRLEWPRYTNSENALDLVTETFHLLLQGSAENAINGPTVAKDVAAETVPV